MSLRTKIVYILLSVVALYTAIDNGSLRFFASRFFQDWESDEGREDVERVLEAVDQRLWALEQSARIWASLDQTWRLVDSEDAELREAFIRDELGPDALESAGVDLFYLCDDDGQVLWSYVIDPESGERIKLTKTLPSQELETSSFLLTMPPGAAKVSGLMMTAEHGPLLIASMPIRDEEGRGLKADGRSSFQKSIYGNVILGRFIDAEMRANIGAAAGCEVLFYSGTSAGLAPAVQAIVDGITALEYKSETLVGEDDKLHAYAGLLDLNTHTPFVVEAIVDRKITRLGGRAVNYVLLSSAGSILVILFVLLKLLERIVLRPLGSLTGKAMEIGKTENTTLRVDLQREDEFGILGAEFDRMLEKLAVSRAQVIQTARKAGMSEIATGVLHNVGNVLNSVNVSASLVSKSAEQLALSDLETLVQVLGEQGDNLATFITEDPRGKHFMPFLKEVSMSLRDQKASIVEELRSLSGGIDHIADLVRAQQTYAGTKGVLEFAILADEVEQAIHICHQAIDPGGAMELLREFDEIETVMVDKHKLMEILVNLLQNAHQALAVQAGESQRITLRILRLGADAVRIEVEDNGMGISSENMSKVFNHGFTTKQNGHGFGLHVSANAATEMNACLNVRSSGLGQGATFFLDLPLQSNELQGAA